MSSMEASDVPSRVPKVIITAAMQKESTMSTALYVFSLNSGRKNNKTEQESVRKCDGLPSTRPQLASHGMRIARPMRE